MPPKMQEFLHRMHDSTCRLLSRRARVEHNGRLGCSEQPADPSPPLRRDFPADVRGIYRHCQGAWEKDVHAFRRPYSLYPAQAGRSGAGRHQLSAILYGPGCLEAAEGPHYLLGRNRPAAYAPRWQPGGNRAGGRRRIRCAVAGRRLYRSMWIGTGAKPDNVRRVFERWEELRPGKQAETGGGSQVGSAVTRSRSRQYG